jgi:hypothetical protein
MPEHLSGVAAAGETCTGEGEFAANYKPKMKKIGARVGCFQRGPRHAGVEVLWFVLKDL